MELVKMENVSVAKITMEIHVNFTGAQVIVREMVTVLMANANVN